MKSKHSSQLDVLLRPFLLCLFMPCIFVWTSNIDPQYRTCLLMFLSSVVIMCLCMSLVVIKVCVKLFVHVKKKNASLKAWTIKGLYNFCVFNVHCTWSKTTQTSFGLWPIALLEHWSVFLSARVYRILICGNYIFIASSELSYSLLDMPVGKYIF